MILASSLFGDFQRETSPPWRWQHYRQTAKNSIAQTRKNASWTRHSSPCRRIPDLLENGGVRRVRREQRWSALAWRDVARVARWSHALLPVHGDWFRRLRTTREAINRFKVFLKKSLCINICSSVVALTWIQCALDLPEQLLIITCKNSLIAPTTTFSITWRYLTKQWLP